MAIIYFDQRIWIDLLKCHKNIKEYTKYRKICQRISASAISGEHKFPFSANHFFETIKRTKLESRKELFQLIFNYSKFNSILPWTKILNSEIRNAILISLDCKSVNLSNIVFGDGVGYCFGCKENIVSKNKNSPIPNDIKKKIFSALKNPSLVPCREKPTRFSG